MRQILIPGFSCFISGLIEEPDNELSQSIAEGFQFIYIQTSNGIFIHRELRPGKNGTRRFIRVPVKEVPGLKLAKLEAHAQFLPEGKIPNELLDTVKAFFKELMIKKSTAVEAMIWILWNEEKGYHLFVPNQVVSRASATYEWSGLPSDSIIVVDIHSHADFIAFFSGTDDKDDANSIRFSVVIGNNNTDNPSIKARFNCLDVKTEVGIDTIFAKSPVKIEIPEEWIDTVKTHTPNTQRSFHQGAHSPLGLAGSPSSVTNVRRIRAESEDVSGETYSEWPYPIVGMDGRPRTPTGPTYDGSKVIKQGDESPSQGQLDLGDKKKHFGQQQTTSATNDQTSNTNVGTYHGPVTNPTIKRMHGRVWLDTGSGLIDITDQESENTPVKTRTDLISDAIEEVTGTTSSKEHPLDRAAQRAAWEEHLNDPELNSWMDRAEKQLTMQNNENLDDLLEKVGMTPADLPINYDLLVCNHGIDVANAYAVVTHMSTSLVDSDSVLDLCLEEFFSLKDDEGKLSSLRTLYQLLPESAKEKLAHSGF